ncbi:hypothetical protein [Streptomyces fractus]|uniref:bestrophin-like domain n=1 Tax=Streptomyces fractus TaxID=641806 RepID=UPI003CF9FA52
MYLQGALVVLAAFLCGAGLTWLWHRLVRPRASSEGLPLMAAACGTVASMYVLTIAFLIVSASSSLRDAQNEAEAEAGALRNAYLVAQYFPTAERRDLQSAVRDYTDTVITKEWPALSREKAAPEAWNRLDALNSRMYRGSGEDSRLHGDLRAAVDDVYAQRRLRVAAAAEHVPGLLLGFLITTAFAVPCFFLLMGWPSGVRPVLGMGTIVALCAFGIWIVLQLNHPYGSGVRIAPDSFRDALVRMEQIDAQRSAGR